MREGEPTKNVYFCFNLIFDTCNCIRSIKTEYWGSLPFRHRFLGENNKNGENGEKIDGENGENGENG